MSDSRGKKKEDHYRAALKGRKIPILTMDKKWYKLFDKLGRDGVAEYEEALNSLIRKQGRLTNQSKELKILKKKLMNEIMNMASEEASDDKDKTAALEKHKALVEECNEKLAAVEDEGRDLPYSIDEVNLELMISTMENCYDVMQENAKQISEIEAWVKQVRVELKKKLIEKQSMEQKNQEIYKYMHDIFGAEVVDLFDLEHEKEE